MITYEDALNYYHAAELAANDSKNWTEEERKVLVGIINEKLIGNTLTASEAAAL